MNITIDGRPIFVPGPSTVLEAARANGIDIPTLCDHAALRPFGGCRLCLVEIKGRRDFAPACGTAVGTGYAQGGCPTRGRRASTRGRCATTLVQQVASSPRLRWEDLPVTDAERARRSASRQVADAAVQPQKWGAEWVIDSAGRR